MDIEIFKGVIFNIGMLVLIAQILGRMRIVKKFVVRQKHTLRENMIMILIFGTISILSTHMGISVHDALANTRVIGVMAAGFIGGPVVGISTAIIASIHRYLIDINGFTAFACAISTLAEGIIAVSFTGYVKKTKYQESDLFLLTFIAEILQMVIILLIAKPYSHALELVRAIAGPMILFNSIGMVLFVGVFKNIILEQEYEIGKKVGLIFDITKKCLPILQTGLYDQDSCRSISKIILESTKDLGIIFTDTAEILSSEGKNLMYIPRHHEIPELARRTICSGSVCVAEETAPGDILSKAFQKSVAIAAPLRKNDKVFGCMIIFTNKYKISLHSDIEFADGLSKFLSIQLELSQIEKQQRLLEKAEFQALQSQINPHFIFNSLNTISAFCREKPGKARELLIALATYFRNSIQTQDGFVSIYDELDYVEAYLQLEKARFEDRLQIITEIPESLDCQLPCLILQPVVENAVKHGAMKRKQGTISITAEEQEDTVIISVSDNGLGIPEDLLLHLKANTMDCRKIGLSNVERRLRYIYGRGLDISSTPEGTTVRLHIPLRKNSLRLEEF